MSNCELCGEPMPLGEEMFKYHGYSCECPKTPLPKPPKSEVTIPRAQHEALMAAANYVMHEDDEHYFDDSELESCPRCKVIAALRAADIEDCPND